MSFVLDNSVALSWVFRDEASPQSAALFKLAATNSIYTPALWPIEFTHRLMQGMRFGRLTTAELNLGMSLFELLDIHVDPALDRFGPRNLFQVAQQYSLTAYDASYLLVAQSRSLPLATFDTRMARAAEASGLKVL